MDGDGQEHHSTFFTNGPKVNVYRREASGLFCRTLLLTELGYCLRLGMIVVFFTDKSWKFFFNLGNLLFVYVNIQYHLLRADYVLVSMLNVLHKSSND